MSNANAGLHGHRQHTMATPFPSLHPHPHPHPTAAGTPRMSSKMPFPLAEMHVARFGSYARSTAFSSIGLVSSVPTKLPITPMHPSFVHTAPTAAPSSSLKVLTAAPSSNPGLLSPSFLPISCHVSPVRPLDSLFPATTSPTSPSGTDGGSDTATPGDTGGRLGAQSFGARSVDIVPPTIASPTSSAIAPPISMVAPLAATAPASGSPTIVYQPRRLSPPPPVPVPTSAKSIDSKPSLRRNLSSPSPTHHALALSIDPAAIRPASALSLQPLPSAPGPATISAPVSGSKHILSVSSNNHLLCLLASNGHWNSIEVPLSSVPAGAQALALHASERATAFNFADVVAGKLKSARGTKRTPRAPAAASKSNLVVAVTLEIPSGGSEGKDTGKLPKTYALHIYGASTAGNTLEKRLFGLAADVQVIPLDYRPLQIQHVEVHLEGFEPNALLVTDQDGPIHIYAESLSPRTFQHVALDRVFDNFPKIHSNVTRVNIHDSDIARYLGLGYASGELVLIVDHRDPETGLFDRARQSIHTLPLYYTPITAIHFFTAPPLPTSPAPLAPATAGTLHVAVAAASEPAVVLANIHASLPGGGGPPDPIELPHSCAYDAVTCITLEPVLWNGRGQLLLGTYGQRILMYDWVGPADGSMAGGFELVAVKTMAYPVYNMVWTDLDGDGLRELVVVSMYCLHVLQFDIELVRGKLIELVRQHEKEKVRSIQLSDGQTG